MAERDVLNFVDLFCGAGGLSRGLELAGLRCLLGVDFDKAAAATFARNHPNASVFNGDITELTAEKIMELTQGAEIRLVCGGPPCQGVSTVGKGNPNDPRNFLFREFVRVVSVLKPDYVLLENVTGMVGRKNQHIADGINQSFVNLGYNMETRVVMASHYGVPERRRRTVFIGNRLGYATVWPEKKFDIPGRLPRTVGDAFRNISYRGRTFNHDIEAATVRHRVDAERLKHIPEGCGIRYQEDEEAHLPKGLRMGVDWSKIDEGRFRQTKYHRLDRKMPSPTIMTGRYSYYHPTEPRFLTVREAAAIQSFPNDFIFEGTAAQQWRQVGNAVPPLMAKALGLAILETDEHKEAVGKRMMVEIAKVRSRAFHYKDDPLQTRLG